MQTSKPAMHPVFRIIGALGMVSLVTSCIWLFIWHHQVDGPNSSPWIAYELHPPTALRIMFFGGCAALILFASAICRSRWLLSGSLLGAGGIVIGLAWFIAWHFFHSESLHGWAGTVGDWLFFGGWIVLDLCGIAAIAILITSWILKHYKTSTV
jgi:hypothetical protein